MSTGRKAFTLVEMVLAVGVSSIALASVCGAFMAGSRMFAAAFAESELSLRSRELRDKLLFHAAPPNADVAWAGLLSGTNRVLSAVSRDHVRLGCTALSRSFAPVAQRLDLSFGDGRIESAALKAGEGESRWLRPGDLNFSLVPDTTATNAIRLNLVGRVDVAGLKVEHRDVVEVPLKLK